MFWLKSTYNSKNSNALISSLTIHISLNIRVVESKAVLLFNEHTMWYFKCFAYLIEMNIPQGWKYFLINANLLLVFL